MKTFIDRVDPELLPGLAYSAAFPPPTTIDDLHSFRSKTTAETVHGDSFGVTFQDQMTDGLRLRVFTPASTGPHPVIYWIHGGGMIAGSVDHDTSYCMTLSRDTSAVVVAVDYRLSPEHQFPTPLNDVQVGLQWLFDSAEALSIDRHRVAVAGSSAGGGLAAGLTLFNRDSGGPPIAFQYLMYPMLDHTHTSSSSHEFSTAPTWNRAHSQFAWQCYLGDTDREAPAYAVPGLAEDLSNLPPTLIQVGELDLFRDEDISFASRLMQAGVPTELHVYPGAYHGYELNRPDSAVGSQTLFQRNNAFLRAFY
jgi:acetyl esterase/lipase